MPLPIVKNWLKPVVGRSEKLVIDLACLAMKPSVILHQQVAMDEIVGRIADERVAPIFRWKSIGRIDDGDCKPK